jgi:hypothetical protein
MAVMAAMAVEMAIVAAMAVAKAVAEMLAEATGAMAVQTAAETAVNVAATVVAALAAAMANYFERTLKSSVRGPYIAFKVSAINPLKNQSYVGVYGNIWSIFDNAIFGQSHHSKY